MYGVRAASGQSVSGAQAKIAAKYGISPAEAGSLLDEFGAPRHNPRKRSTRNSVRRNSVRNAPRDNPSTEALRALRELDEAGLLSEAVPGEMWRDYGQRASSATQIRDLRKRVSTLDDALDAHFVTLGGEAGFIERTPELAFAGREAAYQRALRDWEAQGQNLPAWEDVPENLRNAVDELAELLPEKAVAAQRLQIQRQLAAKGGSEKPKKPRRKKTRENMGVEALAVARPNPAGATRNAPRRNNMARKRKRNSAVRPNPISNYAMDEYIKDKTGFARNKLGTVGELTEGQAAYLARLAKSTTADMSKPKTLSPDAVKQFTANWKAQAKKAKKPVPTAEVLKARIAKMERPYLTKAGKARLLRGDIGFADLPDYVQEKYSLGVGLAPHRGRRLQEIVPGSPRTSRVAVGDTVTKARAEKILRELKAVKERLQASGKGKAGGRPANPELAAKYLKLAEQAEALGLSGKAQRNQAARLEKAVAGSGKIIQKNKRALGGLSKKISALERIIKKDTGSKLSSAERRAIAGVKDLSARIAKVESKVKNAAVREAQIADLRARANPAGGMLAGLDLPWAHLQAAPGQSALQHYGVNIAGGFVGGFVGGSIVSNFVAGMLPNLRVGPLHGGAIASGLVLAYGLAKGVGPLDRLPPAARAWAAAGAVSAGFAQQAVASYLTRLPLVGPMIGRGLAVGRGGGAAAGIGDLYDDAFNPMTYQDGGGMPEMSEFYSAPVDGTDAYIQVSEPGMDAYIQVNDGLGEFYAAPVDGMDAYIQTGPGNFAQPSVDGMGTFYSAPVDGLEGVDGLAGEEYLDTADIVSELGYGMAGGLQWSKVRLEKAQALKSKYGTAAQIHRCSSPGFAIVGLPSGNGGLSQGVPITRSVPSAQPVSMEVPAQFPVMPASQAPTIQAQQRGVFSEGVFGGTAPHVFA